MRSRLAAVVACALLATAVDARADAPSAEVQAHAAYDRGTAAFRRGDYATAAREYAAADALAPNPVALQAALDACVLADDPVLGVQLLERARAAARSASLDASIAKADRTFAHRTGSVRFACEGSPCLGAVDGAAADVREPVRVRVGSHTVTLEAGGAVTSRVVTVGPDAMLVVTATAPAAGPAAASAPGAASGSVPGSALAPAPASALAPGSAPAADRHGPPPVWFYVALASTVVVGGVTVWSGLDTANRHSDFETNCVPPPPAPTAKNCNQYSSDGQSAQTRTNVLIGVTAALGAATLASAFLVQWHASDAVRVSLGPARAALAVRF